MNQDTYNQQLQQLTEKFYEELCQANKEVPLSLPLELSQDPEDETKVQFTIPARSIIRIPILHRPVDGVPELKIASAINLHLNAAKKYALSHTFTPLPSPVETNISKIDFLTCFYAQQYNYDLVVSLVPGADHSTRVVHVDVPEALRGCVTVAPSRAVLTQAMPAATVRVSMLVQSKEQLAKILT